MGFLALDLIIVTLGLLLNEVARGYPYHRMRSSRDERKGKRKDLWMVIDIRD